MLTIWGHLSQTTLSPPNVGLRVDYKWRRHFRITVSHPLQRRSVKESRGNTGRGKRKGWQNSPGCSTQ